MTTHRPIPPTAYYCILNSETKLLAAHNEPFYTGYILNKEYNIIYGIDVEILHLHLRPFAKFYLLHKFYTTYKVQWRNNNRIFFQKLLKNSISQHRKIIRRPESPQKFEPSFATDNVYTIYRVYNMY